MLTLILLRRKRTRPIFFPFFVILSEWLKLLSSIFTTWDGEGRGGGGGGRKIEDCMVFKGNRPGNGPCHGFPKRLLQKKKDSTLTLFQIIVLVAIRGQESVSLVTIMQTVGRLIQKLALAL